MFKKLALALAFVIAIFCLIASLQSSEFHVARSATIAASPEAVFAQVNDMHSWELWSPWEKIDPAMQKTFSGPPAGVGASYSWAGNSEVGEGRSTITESRPYDLIRFKLEMIKPFAGTNDVEFTFKPEGSATLVTWSMSGQKNFITKAVGLIINCDKMIGDQFDKGLAQLKAGVESP